MSGQSVGAIPGFYGKLLCRGDFVSRRLPREFIDAWDAWLQSGMDALRAERGETWLSAYLRAPIWRFTLAADVCGEQAWVGILMPSVDRVGRHYPLTIAAPMASCSDTQAQGDDEAWFAGLEEAALATLDEAHDLPALDAALLALPCQLLAGTDANRASRWWTSARRTSATGGLNEELLRELWR